MANFEATSLTNEFRVTDEKKYEALFSKLCSDGNIEDFSYKEGERIVHQFGCYGDITAFSEDDDYYCLDNWLDELSKIMADGEVFAMQIVGNEKLRYVQGLVVGCTNKETFCHTLDGFVEQKIKEVKEKDSKIKKNQVER